MAIIKRIRSTDKEEIDDDIQAISNSDAESKKLKRTVNRALTTIRSDNVGSNFVAERSNYLDGHNEAYLVEDQKESENREGVELIGSSSDRFYNPSDFAIGDVIWAKFGKIFAFWPAVVVDLSCEVPPAVLKLKAINPGAICVMFYGHSRRKREYGWIKAGNIFPFDAYMHRFYNPKKLYNSKLSDFQMAINEGIATVCADVVTRPKDSVSSIQRLVELKQLCSSGGSNQTRFSDNLDRNVVHDKKVSVVCNSVLGTYDQALNKVVECICAQTDSCKSKKYTLNGWEKHTGCRAKKWKISIRVQGSNHQTLSNWIAENDGRIQLGKQQLFDLLEENYEPVHVRWTAERCAICRWIVDWDYNKIIICNICQVTVHQECYGVKGSQNLASWVCRACETPEVKRECCLCPVKGGALKPTDVEPLWVHVTCAWFQPVIGFKSVEEMEPAVGFLKIPAKLFDKACVICKQVHGSCMECDKCSTYFHATCASSAGYRMELHCIENNQTYKTYWIAYCAVHGTPRADNLLVIKTPRQMFSNTSLPQREFHEQWPNGSRTISTADTATLLDSLSIDGYESEEMSAARCRIYNRSSIKRMENDSLVHRLKRPSHHSLEDIRCLNLHKDTKDDTNDFCHFSTLGERLEHLKMTGNYNVCLGKSRIHGWGIFARRNIRNGEMIMEYCGERVRRIIGDLREVRYQSQGKDCYFFKINDEILIDATNKGNISRLLNHSCMPNCCARIVSVGTEDDNRILLIATSDISTGEEITSDYLSDSDECNKSSTPCMCNAPKCKKIIYY